MVTIGTTEYDIKWNDHPIKYDADGKMCFEHHPKWDDSKYLQWLKEIWHVEIHEEARHLWPGQWTISGHWEDEKSLYKKYEKIWEDKRDEAWRKKNEGKPILTDAETLQQLANSDEPFIQYGEDYFHWNVETPGWSMHRNGTWMKMLIDTNDWKGKTRDQYPGIYNSYEHACKTLADYCDLAAPRFSYGELKDYEKHLKDFVENYNYDK